MLSIQLQSTNSYTAILRALFPAGTTVIGRHAYLRSARTAITISLDVPHLSKKEQTYCDRLNYVNSTGGHELKYTIRLLSNGALLAKGRLPFTISQISDPLLNAMEWFKIVESEHERIARVTQLLELADIIS